jgi:hypothetical protein
MGPCQNAFKRILRAWCPPNLFVFLSERLEWLFHQMLREPTDTLDFFWFGCRSGDKAQSIALSHPEIAKHPEFDF